MALLNAGLVSRVRHLIPELLKFGIVGGIGSVIDLGGAAMLHSMYHVGPLASKAISVSAATAFTYLGSRFWTFKDRENQTMGREAVLFVVLNVAGLLIAEAVIGLVTYVMGLRGQLEYNMASVLGTGLGTIFRFYAYRKWVFLAPAEQFVAAGAEMPSFPDYPPWEPDPRLLAPATAYSSWQPAAEGSSWGQVADQGQPWMSDPRFPNERVASSILAASTETGHGLDRPAAPRPAPSRSAPARSAPARSPAPRSPGRHRRH